MSEKSSRNPNLQALKESWDSPYVAREQVSKFSGGALNHRTMANLDSKGEGPANRIRIGRKIVYPVDSLVSWMESRSLQL